MIAEAEIEEDLWLFGGIEQSVFHAIPVKLLSRCVPCRQAANVDCAHFTVLVGIDLGGASSTVCLQSVVCRSTEDKSTNASSTMSMP